MSIVAVCQAYDYVAWKLARAMPMLPPFGLAFKDALLEAGYRPYGGTEYPAPSLIVRQGYQWVGYSLFDAGNNFQRNAADALLEPRANLKVKTRHTVKVGRSKCPTNVYTLYGSSNG